KQLLTDRMEIISKLQSDRVAVVHMLDELVRVVPGGVYLTALKQRGSTLEIEGVAQSNASVSDMMRQLDSAHWLGDPRLDIIESKDKRSSNRNSRFVLRVKHIIARHENRVEAG
ncbi:MAG TPA: pilus assembly protein PilN, partial [Gammaproteobacteria bacterium]|nr:pilus assembly protein PilN [Gammaproteobacteria bacterium]